jgi:hypothetical protein
MLFRAGAREIVDRPLLFQLHVLCAVRELIDQ